MPADATAACALAGAGEGSGVGVQGREGTGLRVFIRGTVDLLRAGGAALRLPRPAAAPPGAGAGAGRMGPFANSCSPRFYRVTSCTAVRVPWCVDLDA